MVGRASLVALVRADLQERRLVSLVGPGGIGKTTLARAVVQMADPGLPVHFVDLASLDAPSLLPSALVAEFRLPILHANPMAALLAHLRTQKVLIVLDSCERLTEALGPLVEKILHATFEVRILATSREPLRAEVERVHRLPPLEVPSAESKLTSSAMLSYSAVQLFVERAGAVDGSFAFSDSNAASVGAICRRLDGIPLALELAAARIEHFGVAGVEARLTDRFGLLTRGKRTALRRHQTLRATLDWSYETLPPEEQKLLIAVAIFNGRFTLDDASAISVRDASGCFDLHGTLERLLEKSLLSAGSGSGSAGSTYLLLDTTRAYCREKLQLSGNYAECARSHAALCRACLEQARVDLGSLSRSDWLNRYAAAIVEIRAALEWAFGGNGDVEMGAGITIASAPLWHQLAMLAEYRTWLARALDVTDAVLQARQALQLTLELGHALMHSGGILQHRDCAAVFETALELAEQTGDRADILRALWGAFVDRMYCGDYRRGLQFAERYGESHSVAGPSEVAHSCLMALAFHYNGEHAQVGAHVDRVLAARVSERRSVLHSNFQIDQRVLMLALRARTEWMQGNSVAALHLADACIEEALEVGHGISTGYALAVTASIALWAGDLRAARRYIDLLGETARASSLPNSGFWRLCLDTALGLRTGDVAEGPEVLGALLANPMCGPLHIDVLGTLDRRLVSPLAIARAENGFAGASTPEILRLHGENILLRASPGGMADAEASFRLAIACARTQTALAWEVRASLSLARLLIAQRRGAEAGELLGQLCGRGDAIGDNTDLAEIHRLMNSVPS
ncbi:ATP-binding protein [Massilia cavernae]|nr:AAA family ATPase [Massilia cavernae]